MSATSTIRSWTVFGAVIVLVAIGCSVETSDEGVEAATLPQIDVGYFNLIQSDSLVASGWKGTLRSGQIAEYWATRESYRDDEPRVYQGSKSLSCAEFKEIVCGEVWAGARYYQATVHQSVLDCTGRRKLVAAPANAVSLLGAGSYQMVDSTGEAFAWTYASNGVEYWGMSHLISSDTTSEQSPIARPYRSPDEFAGHLCARRLTLPTWLTAYYTPAPRFCVDHDC